jgi:putative ABC transport system permease protein
MGNEIRFAFRRLLKSPAFTAMAVATLALGIGANAAIFSVVEAVLLRPLPYPEAGRLLTVWQDWSRRDGPQTEWFSPGNFLDWRRDATTLDGMAAFADWQPTRTGSGGAERLTGGAVTHGFFDVLGTPPALGRAFSEAEDLPGGERVVVLSHATWRDRFGAAEDVVGETLQLDGEAHEVIGVLPEGFSFPLLAGTDVFRALRIDPADAPRDLVFLRVVARLAPGASLEQARTDLGTVAARLAAEYPESNTGVGAHVVPLRDQLVGDLRPALLALLGAVGLVLLIACVNLTTLLLVRAQGRRRERAVRRALGAGRTRLAAGVLVESLLVAAAGAVAGVVAAGWIVAGLRALAPIPLPAMFEPTVDGGVLLFAAALALAAAAASGLVPALGAGERGGLMSALREGGAGAGTGRRDRRTRSLLAAGQVALAFTLVVGAGLLLRSFVELQRVDPGFEPSGLLTFRVIVPDAGYPERADVAAFYARYLERLGALPGVESASMVSWMPMSGADTDVTFVVEGEPPPEPGRQKAIWYRQVDPGYFRTLHIPLLAGRAFTPADGAEAPPVVVLGETAARAWFGGEDAVGKRLKPGDDPESDEPWWTVVGVVGSVRHAGLAAEPKHEIYLPHAQSPRASMTLVLRTAGAPQALVPPARAALADLDPTLALAGVQTASELVAGSLALPRFLALCVLAFGAVALFLAALGVYGVVAEVVGRRTRELGLRMALGADRSAVLRLVMRQGLALAAAGLVAGLAGALLTGRLLEGLLFQVAPRDLATLAAATALLATVALLAAWLPARRATRLDPLAALREE